MDLRNFKEEFEAEIKSSAESNMWSDRKQFVETVTETLIEMGELNGFNYSYFENEISNKKVLLDGYAIDETNKELVLVICDYYSFQGESTLTKSDALRISKYATNFLLYKKIILEETEESSEAWQFSDLLKDKWKDISRVKIVFITDQSASKQLKKIESSQFQDRDVNYSIWGLERIQEVFNSKFANEPTEIIFEDYGFDGLPSLKANIEKESNYDAYLTIISGEVLADIYNQYGATLLEGNVRSYLMNRGKVNRGIRKTILENPEMFFAYNNGIAATATSIETINKDNQILITRIDNLQIVNGGQTTASIFNVKHVEKKGNTNHVFVPMKLSVIPDEELAEKIIPDIAKFANNQNRVSEADFFSNHPFHVAIEKISRNLLAPAVDNNQYGTHWFYERARGQYNQGMMKMTFSGRKAYQQKNPKQQVITKTDLAKYYYSLHQRPDFVSLGAQRNFMKFADFIVKDWTNKKPTYNNCFYKNMVVNAILFKTLEKLVSSSDWYQQAFRANIVTYSISFFYYQLSKTLKNMHFDFEKIWKLQTIPYPIIKEFEQITYKIFIELTRSEFGRTKNITEWAKKLEAWEETKKNVSHTFSTAIMDYMISIDEYIKIMNDCSKAVVVEEKINSQIEVVNKGSLFWERVHKYCLEYKIINSMENDILKIASKMQVGKIPSENQSNILMALLAKIENDGFNIQ